MPNRGLRGAGREAAQRKQMGLWLPTLFEYYVELQEKI